jgi:U3 small nucleolar ribonucleoprotein protein IMP4
MRKEYLYRKSLQGEDRLKEEQKKQVRDALASGTPLPSVLAGKASSLLAEMEFEENVKTSGGKSKKRARVDDEEDDTQAKKAKLQEKRFSKITSNALAMDSEYSTAGYADPHILITTSRDPSSRLASFAKELKLIFPNSVRINRGNHLLSELTETCKAHQATDLILVHETRGQPDGLIVSHMPYGPTAYFALSNVVPRHDIDEIGTMSLATPHLIFENFSTMLGERVITILKHLFPPTKDESQRVLTFANVDDYISFRHHTWKKAGHKDVELEEVGPRFEMQLYHIKMGTLEMTDAETEWVLRPYMNTSKTRKLL